jgi:hypothetical protein
VKRTIPEPTNSEYSTALRGIVMQMESHGLSPKTDMPLLAHACHQAEVTAQYIAEVRWLRNMLHKQTQQTVRQQPNKLLIED